MNISNLLRHAMIGVFLMCASIGIRAEVVKPEAGHTYLIINKKTGGVLSNNDSQSTDAPIYCIDRDDTSYGQRWTLVNAGNGAFALKNEASGMGLDAAINGNGKTPLQWTLDPSNSNQQCTFVAADGDNNAYQLSFSSKGIVYYLGLGTFDAYTKLYTSSTEESTLFTLEETEPAPEPEHHDWEDETVFAVGKEKGHATYMPYPSTEALHADAARYASTAYGS